MRLIQLAFAATIVAAGARVRLRGGLHLQMGVVHQTEQVANGHPLALDVGLTYSVRH